MKECTTCHLIKDDEEFNFKNSKTGKRQSSCKVCTRLQSKKHYSKHTKDYVERSKQQRTDLADRLREFKTTLRCSVCGENDYVCLDFHHTDPLTKECKISSLATCGSWKKVQEEIDKCIVLCSNCHRKIHAGRLIL